MAGKHSTDLPSSSGARQLHHHHSSHRVSLATRVLVWVLFFEQSLSAVAFVLQRNVPRCNIRILNQLHNDDDDDDNHATNGASSQTDGPPRHVAFICDGNSRWARARDLPASAGHAAGAERLADTLDVLNDAGVQYCTMFGFSTENWKRSNREIGDILTVMEQTARRFYNRALRENVRVKILGDLTDERIPRSLLEILQRLERETSKTNHRGIDDQKEQQQHTLTLCLAINYGGRRDIVNASKRIAERVLKGKMNVEDITEETFAGFLSTAGIPDPDLIIRTSGESRLSNFLNWNAAYSELYFTDVLWPDFDEECIGEALDWYSQRRRRFGARQSVERKPAVL